LVLLFLFTRKVFHEKANVIRTIYFTILPSKQLVLHEECRPSENHKKSSVEIIKSITETCKRKSLDTQRKREHANRIALCVGASFLLVPVLIGLKFAKIVFS